MIVLNTVAEVRSYRKSQINHDVGFVPTMGALHEGHLQLVRRALQDNDRVIVSIFVNPTQFGPGEDLDKYPRAYDDDCNKLKAISENIVMFFPEDKTVLYPNVNNDNKEGDLIQLKPLAFDTIAESISRPNFFNGVAQICCKLFNIVQPSRTYFGQKDIAQCVLIKRMISDLLMDIEVIIVPTIRESDGLAMSSRNVYMNSDERKIAPLLYQALLKGKEYWENTIKNNTNSVISKHDIVKEIESSILTYNDSNDNNAIKILIQYISVAEPKTMQEIKLNYPQQDCAIVSIAAMVGNVRLIDNVIIGESAVDYIFSNTTKSK